MKVLQKKSRKEKVKDKKSRKEGEYNFETQSGSTNGYSETQKEYFRKIILKISLTPLEKKAWTPLVKCSASHAMLSPQSIFARTRCGVLHASS
jgi:hypothetical protein